MIILIGDKQDPHLIEIKEKITFLNWNCKIFSTSKIDLLSTIYHFNGDNGYLIQNDDKIEFDQISSAFCLSPLYRVDYNDFDQENRFWHYSWRDSLFGFLYILSKNNVLLNGPIEQAIGNQNKIKLFPIAQSVGLNIPSSIITNSKHEIEKFFRENTEVVIKTLHQMNLKLHNEPTMLLVQKVFSFDFLDYNSECESPLFLQKYIDKIFDFRVVVIGNEMLVCKIDSSKSTAGKVDWRAYDLPQTPHEVMELSEQIKRKILYLMSALCLDYACLDFCIDTSQVEWLLDVNPFGRFLWMEYGTGMDVTGMLARFLITRSNERLLST